MKCFIYKEKRLNFMKNHVGLKIRNQSLPFGTIHGLYSELIVKKNVTGRE